jgi:hypothetical protein
VGGNFPDTPSNIVITPLGPPSNGGEEPGDGEEEQPSTGDPGTGPSASESDVLIPQTGVDLTGFRNPRVRTLAQIGALFLGIGLVLHGISMRTKSRLDN